MWTPVLTPGNYYEFETDNLSAGGDTVMTLMTGTGGSGFGTTVIGADSCPRRSTYEASCFSFYVNPVLYPTARNFLLVVRSWTSASSGTADIRIQQITSGGTPVNTPCIPMLPIRPGCWSTWPNLSFGSYVHSGFGTAATNYHFETTERPGSSTAPDCLSTPQGRQPSSLALRATGARQHRSTFSAMTEVRASARTRTGTGLGVSLRR